MREMALKIFSALSYSSDCGEIEAVNLLTNDIFS